MTDDSLEIKVKNSFLSSPFEAVLSNSHQKIGIAVSGGADSVSLLIALVNIFGNERIKVITVNHNIRSAEESGGDCEFVQALCSRLDVMCSVYEIPAGKIKEESEKNKWGIEETARKFRYQFFEEFILDNDLVCLCLAHNQNDQLETLLMRFLKGSSTEGLCGIKQIRNKYFRPLLNVSREEIECYLNEKNIPWRTDSTNFDNNYLRNKIRNLIIPVLNENIEGWQEAVLTGKEKIIQDEYTLNKLASKLVWNHVNDTTVSVLQSDLMKCDDSVFRRCIYNGLKLLGFGDRVPSTVIRQLKSIKKGEEICFSTLKFVSEGDLFFIKKNEIQQTETSFFAIIEEPCKDLRIPGTPLNISCDSKGNLSLRNEELNSFFELMVQFPFAVRSVVSGDVIADAKGELRSVSKILKNQHVKSSDISLIPVIEVYGSQRNIIAVAGSLAGYSNWIVKGNS